MHSHVLVDHVKPFQNFLPTRFSFLNFAMLGAASMVSGWISGATGSKDDKKAIEMQQKQSQDVKDAAQKQVDDRRQQYNASDVENQNPGENVCMSVHFSLFTYYTRLVEQRVRRSRRTRRTTV